MRRLLAHLLTTRSSVRRAFPAQLGDKVEAAVRQAEKAHEVELRVVAEPHLPLGRVLARQTSRHRAVELFSLLRVWDTEHNCGVLIYVLMADRKIEIVADRGISAKVPQREWDRICRQIAGAFREKRFEQGTLLGINEVLALLKQHVPGRTSARNEIPDAPAIL
jgi:uncharacterized membrane protein